MNERDLIDLKRKIDDAKTKTSELRGRQDYLEKELKQKYGCSSVKEADKKIETMKEEIADLDEQIKDGLQELEEEMR